MKANSKKEINEHKRKWTGTVVSTKMKDTIVVAVDNYFKHKKYGKFITRTKRFKVHDSGNTCKEGEIVYIQETRPMSKDKRFIVVGKKTAVIAETAAA